MLLYDAPLTFGEFMTHEDVPLADVFREVLGFLADQEDAVVFGAQAINAYCDPPRMTADIDILSTHAAEMAERIRAHLAQKFHIAVRTREVAGGSGHRVYQVRKPRNRHLVDLRQVPALPSFNRIEQVRVAAPAELAALKVISIAARRGREKELSDRLDLHRLLRAFPDLRAEEGVVTDRLRAASAPEATLALWRELAQEHLEPDSDDY